MSIFALVPARALAVKNIYANLELTNRFLLIIDTTGSCLFIALVPARALAVKNIRKP